MPLTVSGQNSSDTLHVKHMRLEDYSFYLKWAGFGIHADTLIIPNLKAQLNSCENELIIIGSDRDKCDQQQNNLELLIESKDLEIKKANRKFRLALIGDFILGGLVSWFVIKP